MNTNTSVKTRIFLPIALICAVVASLLRAISLLFFFDTDIAHYVSGAALPIISNIFLLSSVIFFCVYALLCFRDKKLSPPERTSVFGIASALVTALAAIFVAFYPPSNSIAGVATNPLLSILSLVMSLVTAAYFVLAVTNAGLIFKVITGIVAILRFAIMLADSYFGKGMGMNAPNKVLFGLTCVVVMLFLISELKTFADNCRTWLYICSAASVTTLCLAMSIPSVIAYHTGTLTQANDSYAEYYLFFGIALYAASRLISSVVKINGQTATSSPELGE